MRLLLTLCPVSYTHLSVPGKKDQHATHVQVDEKTCVGCGKCVKACPQKALSLPKKKSQVDVNRCIGCFECITVCPVKAISLDWATEIDVYKRQSVARLTEKT